MEYPTERQEGLAGLKRLMATFQKLQEDFNTTSVESKYNIASALLGLIAFEIEQCLDAGIADDLIVSTLGPLRSFLGASKLVCRIQTWPRGYPGDFETIELFFQNINHHIHDAEHLGNTLFMRSAIVQQHRNKVSHQCQLILDVFERCRTPRILSMACGGSRDVFLALPAIKDREAQWVFNDIDPDAIQLTRDRTRHLRGTREFYAENIVKTIYRKGWENHFDLIIMGGIFDYLNDERVVKILSRVLKAQAQGGVVYFSNIAKHNAFRYIMEYLCDWVLIERDESEIIRLCTAAGVDPDRIRMTRDLTGLSLLVEISA